MVKVVADTNIYISALFWRGNPYKFIHLCFEGKARLVISRQIIDELERILLTDKKFELPREDVALYSEIIIKKSNLFFRNLFPFLIPAPFLCLCTRLRSKDVQKIRQLFVLRGLDV
jgi:hypothetical protein